MSLFKNVFLHLDKLCTYWFILFQIERFDIYAVRKHYWLKAQTNDEESDSQYLKMPPRMHCSQFCEVCDVLLFYKLELRVMLVIAQKNFFWYFCNVIPFQDPWKKKNWHFQEL